MTPTIGAAFLSGRAETADQTTFAEETIFKPNRVPWIHDGITHASTCLLILSTKREKTYLFMYILYKVAVKIIRCMVGYV